MSVIPGRAAGANPESRNEHRVNIWIPGPALARRPGMTACVGDNSTLQRGAQRLTRRSLRGLRLIRKQRNERALDGGLARR